MNISLSMQLLEKQEYFKKKKKKVVMKFVYLGTEHAKSSTYYFICQHRLKWRLSCVCEQPNMQGKFRYQKKKKKKRNICSI